MSTKRDSKIEKQLREEIALYDVETPTFNDNPTYQRGYKAGLQRALRIISQKNRRAHA